MSQNLAAFEWLLFTINQVVHNRMQDVQYQLQEVGVHVESSSQRRPSKFRNWGLKQKSGEQGTAYVGAKPLKLKICKERANDHAPSNFFSFYAHMTSRAGLTIVPVVPWEGAPAARGLPPINCQIFTTLFWPLNGLNVATTKKKSSTFWEKKSAPPEKILAMRMRKGPRIALVWGPRMVNPALMTRFSAI